MDRLDVPVFSIGNLTVGGTGKTPLVQWLCRFLRQEGRRPAVISRGYGRRYPVPQEIGKHRISSANDEALETMRACPGVPVLLGRNRAAAGAEAISRWDADCLVLDDGFQHCRLIRDVDIVAVDASRPFGNGHCLPAGPLREPLSALSRADIIALTRASDATEEELARTRRRIAEQTDAPVISVCFELLRLSPLPSLGTYNAVHPPDRAMLLSGIGNPLSFERLVRRAGIEIAGHLVFPDHAVYGERTLACLRQQEHAVLVTTKDAVKLAPLVPPDLAERILVAEIGLDPVGRTKLERTFLELIRR